MLIVSLFDLDRIWFLFVSEFFHPSSHYDMDLVMFIVTLFNVDLAMLMLCYSVKETWSWSLRYSLIIT